MLTKLAPFKLVGQDLIDATQGQLINLAPASGPSTTCDKFSKTITIDAAYRAYFSDSDLAEMTYGELFDMMVKVCEQSQSLMKLVQQNTVLVALWYTVVAEFQAQEGIPRNEGKWNVEYWVQKGTRTLATA